MRKSKLQAASCKLQAASCKLQAASFKLQAASFKLQASSYKLQAASCKLGLTTYDIAVVDLAPSKKQAREREILVHCMTMRQAKLQA
jgi:division protein CdvB (Snf7/Vps24/ESCRT-III family)